MIEDRLVSRPANVVIDGEVYHYTYSYYKDMYGSTYTTTEIDEANMAQVCRQYEERHGEPLLGRVHEIG